jgi:hypothetical protein
MRIIQNLIIIVFFNAACNSTEKKPNTTIVQSDTLKAITTLLNEDFLARNMPGYGAPGVGQPSIFGDTILLEYNDSLDKYVPAAFGTHYLKRITRDELCRLSIVNRKVDFPDFLQLLDFEKTDSGYRISLQATCVFPDENKIANNNNSLPCIFGMLCGGGISVLAQKSNDTFRLKRLGGWSD